MNKTKPLQPLFKAGDWILVLKQDTQPIQIGKDDLKDFNKVEGEFHFNNAKLWQPKLLEYCWFWDKYDSNRTLAQFKDKTIGNKYHTIEDDRPIKNKMNDNVYDHCEPFIGTLPSCIKESNE